MIKINNLTKKYGDKIAVDNISFDIKDGELFAFIGHNGAGKTTTIKSLVGINDFDSGDILVDNISIKEDPISVKKLLAYVPDNPDLYENMKAIDYINFICDMYEVSDRSIINKYADMFDISNELNNEISTFSHGMKQKVSLIAALCHNPKVLVMDEPFVGLDPKAVFDMKKIMKEMTNSGSIVFFSTHILDVAEKLCDRVAIIKNGKIVKVGNMNDIKGDKSLESVFLDLEENK